MTPPENTERRGGSGGAGADEDVAPPWQRVAKDVDAVSDSDGDDELGERWSAGQLPADETSYQPTQQYSAASGSGSAGTAASTGDYAGSNYAGSSADTQVVSGTAASRLFGGGQSEQATEHMAAPSNVGAAQASGSGGGGKRSTPVSALRRPGRGPRRASLQIKRFDPWSVLKLSLVLGVALFFIWLVAVGVLYTVLEGMGVWDQINGTYTSLVQGEVSEGAGDPFITAPRVFGIAAIVGAINIVLISALTTVSAFIYNVSADLAGGLEVTLSERE